MASLKFLTEILRCPLTDGPLTEKNGELYSAKAEISYPTIQEIPWLFRHPRSVLLEWQGRAKAVMQHYMAQGAAAKQELGKVDLLPTTRTRLENLKVGYETAAEEMTALLEPLFSGGATHSPQDRVFAEKVPRQQSLIGYYHTLFRDWVWGEKEIAAQVQALGIKNPGRLLVLGAGACGLPLKIHELTQPTETLAVDINPLLFLMVKNLIAGKTCKAVEFPYMPRAADKAAVIHEIHKKIPAQVRENFHLLFADAQDLAITPGSFDSLLTPWFIDIVPRNFRELARHLNQGLKKGGAWHNIGVLDFSNHNLSETHGPEEIREGLEEAGFKVEKMESLPLPYIHSPFDTIHRLDHVLIFKAVKEKNAKAPARYEYLPSWLRNLDEAVPQQQLQLFQIKTEVFARVLRLVDGKKSVKQIAGEFAAQNGLPPDGAMESVFNFFSNVFENKIFRDL